MTERVPPAATAESAEAVAVLTRAHELAQASKWRDAFALLDAGLRRVPASAGLHFERGRMAELLVSDEPDRSRDFAAAAEEGFSRALEIDPSHSDAASGLARTLDRRGDPKGAMAVIEPFLRKGAISPVLASTFARIGPRVGEAARACDLLGRVVEAQGNEASALSLHEYARLLDRLERYDEAFAIALRANTLVAEHYRLRGFKPGQMRHVVQTTIQATPRRKMVEAPRAANRSSLPVFIVGMGRSGTTLVEQIIASHPAAHGGGERRALMRTASELSNATGIGGPQAVAGWPVAALDRAAERYLAELAALAPDAQRITDKLPQNFLRLGVIQRLLPAARIIHCRRDPRDVLLSAYFQSEKIPAMEPWNLREAALIYRQQERMMAHWFDVLDLEILPVQYESLVQQPEIETRRIIAFLDLPWDDRCLAIDQNQRIVDTSNYAAVRRRIHGDAVGRWRHYERHLGPMIEALQGRRESSAA